MSSSYHHPYDGDDEALARALQLQYEQEAAAAAAAVPTSSRRREATAPTATVVAVSDEEIARRVQQQENERKEKDFNKQQRKREKKEQRNRSQRDSSTLPNTSSRSSSSSQPVRTATAVPVRPPPQRSNSSSRSRRNPHGGETRTTPRDITTTPAVVSDEELARRLAAQEEEAAVANAMTSSDSRSRRSTKRNTTTSGGFVFPAPTTNTSNENNNNNNAAGGFVFPVPTASESNTTEDDDETEDRPAEIFEEDNVIVVDPSSRRARTAPAREVTDVELSDFEYARRVEQELQDELVAERLQQREQERMNQRRLNQIEHQQQNGQPAVPATTTPRQRRKRLYGSFITIALVVGLVIGLVYYFVILGGGVPNINLTPEDFANEDPFDEMDPQDANAWNNNGNGVQLTVINALEIKWYQYFYKAIDDWENGYPDTLTLNTDFHQTAGVGSHDPACATVSGRVKVCNGNYGNTHWKGINEVLIDGRGRIVASAARMNEFYLSGNDPDQMQYTMCHELGHAWGLPHTDETFGNPDLGDCMDYTNNPAVNRQPRERNFVFLWNMYGTVPGAAPYTPPTPAPTAYEPPTTVVAQNSTVGRPNNNNRQLRPGRRRTKDNVKKDSRSITENAVPQLIPNEPLPGWLTEAIETVLDRPRGELLSGLSTTTTNYETSDSDTLASRQNRHSKRTRRYNSWRRLHSHSHGTTHEIDLPKGFSLRVHFLHAAAAVAAESTTEALTASNNENQLP